MATMSAGQAVIEMLRAEGVDHIFGICGTTTNNILTEMHGRSDIRFVDTRHEQNAAFMAYGYARASGKPTVCLTTSGPGTINLITGIALAYKGRAPVIVLAGDVPRELIDRDGNQAFDLVNLFKPITYMAQHVQTTERVQEAVHNAFRTALSGKRGPVMLNIPRDLLDFKTIDYQARTPDSYRATAGRVQGDREAIARAAAAEANQWLTMKYDNENPQALRRLVAGGALLRAFPKEVTQAAFGAANELYAEMAEKSAPFKKIHAHWAKFRSEQVMWQQLCDLPFDNLMSALLRGKG